MVVVGVMSSTNLILICSEKRDIENVDNEVNIEPHFFIFPPRFLRLLLWVPL